MSERINFTSIKIRAFLLLSLGAILALSIVKRIIQVLFFGLVIVVLLECASFADCAHTDLDVRTRQSQLNSALTDTAHCRVEVAYSGNPDGVSPFGVQFIEYCSTRPHSLKSHYRTWTSTSSGTNPSSTAMTCGVCSNTPGDYTLIYQGGTYYNVGPTVYDHNEYCDTGSETVPVSQSFCANVSTCQTEVQTYTPEGCDGVVTTDTLDMWGDVCRTNHPPLYCQEDQNGKVYCWYYMPLNSNCLDTPVGMIFSVKTNMSLVPNTPAHVTACIYQAQMYLPDANQLVAWTQNQTYTPDQNPDGTYSYVSQTPDGSIVTQTQTSQGDVVMTTTYNPDGTTNVMISNTNGTVSNSTTNPDGMTTTTVTDPGTGQSTTTTQNPNGTTTTTTSNTGAQTTTITGGTSGGIVVVTGTTSTTNAAGNTQTTVTTTTTNSAGQVVSTQTDNFTFPSFGERPAYSNGGLPAVGDFGGLVNNFVTNMKATPLFSTFSLDSLVPTGQGVPTYSWSAGSFGEVEVDFSSPMYATALKIIKAILLLTAGFIAVRAVILRR